MQGFFLFYIDMIVKCLHCSTEFENKIGKATKKFCTKECKVEAWKPFKAIIDKEYALKNLEKKAEYDRIRYEQDPQAAIDRTAKYREGRGKERWQKEKVLIASSFERQTYKNLLTMIGRYVKDNTEPKYGEILNMLQYSIAELKQHLLSTMPNGYNWDDFMSGRLHIDHIKPHSRYKYSSYKDPEYKECWGLSNLRLLSAKENMSKQNKL